MFDGIVAGVVLLLGVAVLLCALVCNCSRRVLVSISVLTYVCSGLSLWTFGHSVSTNYSQYSLILADELAHASHWIILLLGVLGVFIARDYLEDCLLMKGETFVLLLLQSLGLLLVTSSGHWLVLFLGMELSALPVYALAILPASDKRALEGGVKYLLMGVLSSGVLLYGVSVLYAVFGSLELSIMGQTLQMALDGGRVSGVFASSPEMAMVLVLLGLVCVCMGMAFKLGVAPFHYAVVDVYTSCTGVTLFVLATAPKWAFLVLWLRILTESFAAFVGYWQPLMLAMALISLVVGHGGALVQTDVRRLLGYASIAQMGYVCLALAMGHKEGNAASLVYIAVYVATSVIAFALLSQLRQSAGTEVRAVRELTNAFSLQRRHAAIVCVMLFSFMGLPPFVGFMAKVSVMNVLLKDAFYWIAGFAVLISAVGVSYYAALVATMMFGESFKLEQVLTVSQSKTTSLLLTIFVCAWLLMGLYPEPLLRWSTLIAI